MKHDESILSQESLRVISAEMKERKVIRSTYLFLAFFGAAISILISAMFIDWQFIFQSLAAKISVTLITSISLILVLKWAWNKMKFKFDVAETARWIDKVNPKLQERLSTSIELTGSTTYSPGLLKAVGEQVDDYKIKSGGEQLTKSRPIIISGNAFLASIVFFFVLYSITGNSLSTLWGRLVNPWNDSPLTVIAQKESDTFHIRGKDFPLAVNISGKVPAQAKIQKRSINGSIEDHWVDIDKETGSFDYSIPRVSEDFSYRIEVGDAVMAWQKISVVDRPFIISTQVKITPPAYTKIAPWTIAELPRRLKVPQDSQVDLLIEIDQEVVKVTMDSQRNEKLVTEDLTHSSKNTYVHQLNIIETISAEINMTSKIANLKSKYRISIESIDDEVPQVELLEETETFAMTAKEQLTVRFKAQDDYGLEVAHLIAEIKSQDGTIEEIIFPIDLADQRGQKKLESTVELDLSKLPIKESSELTYRVEVKDARGISSSDMSERLMHSKLASEKLELEKKLAQIAKLQQELRSAKEANEKVISNNRRKPDQENQNKLAENTQKHLKLAKQEANNINIKNTNELKSLKHSIEEANKKSQDTKTAKNLNDIKAEIDKANKIIDEMKRQIEKEIAQNKTQIEDRERLKKLSAELSLAKQETSSIRNNIRGQDPKEGQGSEAGKSSQHSQQAKAMEALSKRVDNLKKMAQDIKTKSVRKEVSDAVNKTQDALENSTKSSNAAPELKKAEDQIDKAIQAISKVQENAAKEKNLVKRKIDLRQDQDPSKSSSAQVIVDEYAKYRIGGSGEKKKQIAIQEVLDRILKCALESHKLMREIRFHKMKKQYLARSGEDLKKNMRDRSSKLIELLEDGTARAEELKKVSAKTPYAFFGLQAKAIVESGFNPAIIALNEAKVNPNPDVIKENLDAVDERLRWVISLLQKTESEFQKMIKIKDFATVAHKFNKMHTITIEDMPPGGT